MISLEKRKIVHYCYNLLTAKQVSGDLYCCHSPAVNATVCAVVDAVVDPLNTVIKIVLDRIVKVC